MWKATLQQSPEVILTQSNVVVTWLHFFLTGVQITLSHVITITNGWETLVISLMGWTRKHLSLVMTVILCGSDVNTLNQVIGWDYNHDSLDIFSRASG